MDSDVRIREVRPEELPSLVALCGEHAAFERCAIATEGMAERLADLLFGSSPRLQVLVAERAGRLVGYASFLEDVSTLDAAPFVHMDCLFLRPEARNEGIGRQLMAEIARRALAAGITSMQWQTPDFNTDAVRFYRRLAATSKDKVRLFLDETAMRALAGRP